MRIENWPLLLSAFIESRRNTPFRWGIHDCTLFAADAALAITGVDLAAAYRGTYNNEASAALIVAAAGGFRELVNQNMGAEISPQMAQRGDWVLVETETCPALAVCMGVNMIAAGPDGLISKPMTAAITAWRVE